MLQQVESASTLTICDAKFISMRTAAQGSVQGDNLWMNVQGKFRASSCSRCKHTYPARLSWILQPSKLATPLDAT